MRGPLRLSSQIPHRHRAKMPADAGMCAHSRFARECKREWDLPGCGAVGTDRLSVTATGNPHMPTGLVALLDDVSLIARAAAASVDRSEEHTSELQSLMR